MRKVTIGLVCLALLLVAVAPALAAGGPPTGHGRNSTFALVGTNSGIDGTSVTVQAVGGSKAIHTTIGQPVTVQTTDSTRYLLRTESGAVPITFADLQVGQPVSVMGTVSAEGYVALRITVGAKLIHTT